MEGQMSSQIKVGAFVVVGIIVFCFSVIFFGGDKIFLTSTIEIKARFPQVQGLGKGSVVSLAGLPVGNVGKIEFEPGAKKLLVTLDINQDFQNRITQGATAAVKTQGALGDRYVFIEPGPLDAQPIADGEFIEVSDEGDFLDVITEKTKDLSNVVDVVNETHILLKALNHDGRSALFMSEMVETTKEMKVFLREARYLVKDIRGSNEKDAKLKQSLTHLSNILEKVDRGEGSLGALINDPSLHERLVGILGERPRNRFLKPLIRDSIQRSEGSK